MGTQTFYQKKHQSKSFWHRTLGVIFATLMILVLSAALITAAPRSHAAPTVAVSTFVEASAGMNYPHDIAFDAAGTLYITDSSNHRILAVSPEGVISVFAGSGTMGSANGTGTAAEFNVPHSIAINKTTGIMYVTEVSLEATTTPRVRAITPEGVVTTLAGSGVPGIVDGAGTAAQFFFPTGIVVNESNGMIYVADSYAHSIRAITPAGVVTTLAGFDNILDVVDNPDGGYADGVGTAARFSYPQGIGVDSLGNLYVTEFVGNRIRTISPAGVVTTITGTGVAGNVNGPVASAQFDNPSGIVVTPNGTIYVADTGNNSIRAISPEGVVSNIAGTGAVGSVDGPGENAQFNAPTGIALSASNELYVTDTYNQLIRVVSVVDDSSNPPASGGGAGTQDPDTNIPSAPNTGVEAKISSWVPLAGAGLLILIVISIYKSRIPSRVIND